MPITTSGQETYWIDDPLPSAPNSGVLTNFYVRESDEKVVGHPGWWYGDQTPITYVSNEYLYENESYSLIYEAETKPASSVGSTTYLVTAKDISEWVGYSAVGLGSTIGRLYHQYKIVNNPPTDYAWNQVAIATGYSFVESPSEVATVGYTSETLTGDSLQNRIITYRRNLNELRRTLLDIENETATDLLSRGKSLTTDFQSYYKDLKELTTVGIALSSYTFAEIELTFHLLNEYSSPYYNGEYTTNEDVVRLGIGTHPVFSSLGITTSPDIEL